MRIISNEIILSKAYSYIGITTIHPLALAMTIVCALATLMVKRKYAVIPMLFLACFVASAQRIVIFGLDFDLLRVMVIAGWLRVFLKRETEGFVWKPIDNVMIVWAISGAIAYTFLRGTTGAFINRLGMMFDAIGMYFLFRCLIRDMEDVKQVVVAFMYLSIPVAVFLFLEKQSGHNMFAVFGGVSEKTALREGKLRAQGAFSHPILTGCFWVSQLPLFLALWWQQDVKKWLIAISAIAVLFIVYACASSTPAAGLPVLLCGIVAYAVRHHIKLVWLWFAASLAALHLIMEQPVWYLVSLVDIVGGSTGRHRYLLIDQTVKRFSEWWLAGTLYTGHWGGRYRGLTDTCNAYVDQAIHGGFFTLILFFALIVLAFKGIGSLLLSLKDSNPDYLFAWALGIALFTHCLLFIGVSYFGQTILVWYLLLAVIGSLIPVNQLLIENKTYIASYSYV